MILGYFQPGISGTSTPNCLFLRLEVEAKDERAHDVFAAFDNDGSGAPGQHRERRHAPRAANVGEWGRVVSNSSDVQSHLDIMLVDHHQICDQFWMMIQN